jgi:hypothetical protein
MEGSSVAKLVAFARLAAACSRLFRANSRAIASPVTKVGALSGRAMRLLSRIGPQTIMKKS